MNDGGIKAEGRGRKEKNMKFCVFRIGTSETGVGKGDSCGRRRGL